MNRVTQGSLRVFPWKFLYKSICSGEWLTFLNVRATDFSKIEAKNIYESLKSNDDVEKIQFKGYSIGELVYDTYLRFKPAATIYLEDQFLKELIEKAVEIVIYLENLFKEKKIKRVVVVYSSYLHHGLLVRVALRHNVMVHSMGAFNQLITQPVNEFPYHRKNFLLYKELFKNLKDQDQHLNKGKQLLQNRLSGKIDDLTAYMKKSAYAINDEINYFRINFGIDSRKKIIIMGHDFFDSPHIYGEMLYPDFLSWLEACLIKSSESPYQILVKPHPNGIEGNQEIYENLSRRYPDSIFLSKEVSNLDLKKLDIAYVLSVYGTAIYEFAGMGFNVLSCGINPTSSYNFSYQLKSRQELEDVLLGKFKPSIKINEKELYEFVSVHNYRIELGEQLAFPSNIKSNKLIDYIEKDEQRNSVMKNAYLNINEI